MHSSPSRPRTTISPKCFLGALVLSCCSALAACGSDSSSAESEPASSETPMSRADLGCTGASGPLDSLQASLADRLYTGLAAVPGGTADPAALTALVTDVLDLVDALAAGAGSLAAVRNGGDPSLAAPVYHQLLCVTAGLGELVLSASLAATTPLTELPVLHELLDTLVTVQNSLLLGVRNLPNVANPEQLATDLGYATQTLAGVVAGLATSASILPGGAASAVLMPVSVLLLDITAAFNALGNGDTQAFAQLLLDSVPHLVEGLAQSLGPIGIVLTGVIGLLSPVLDALAGLVGGLLGILL
ncbi:hypothetical protein RM530_02215 [Algiphilus sp. W345]|uniref:Lipoprotein n=1 Tax=Banduia mediterranea TaxID=3075609 RepID=A0ABU2WE90_9GAMM|nr:hypothetical protein [Algiphilus sp. W345]MDT0496181.1 hypothetical protein [Algiphilus sp. W345]